MNSLDLDKLDKLDNTVDTLEWCVKEFLEAEGYKVLDCGYKQIGKYTMPVVLVKCSRGDVGMITTELGAYLINKELIEKGCRHSPRVKMEF